jgi:hypothetical protein
MLAFLLALQGSESDRVLDRYRAARPSEAALAFYRHDWARNFDEAKARAAKEGKPIFLVTVSNLNGYDNLYTGHC